jgi:hypothetical protein
MNRALSTAYTATFSDAFLASERMRLANEGAIQKNIQTLLDEILHLPLASTP